VYNTEQDHNHLLNIILNEEQQDEPDRSHEIFYIRAFVNKSSSGCQVNYRKHLLKEPGFLRLFHENAFGIRYALLK